VAFHHGEVPDLDSAAITAPRLLRGEHGWWYLTEWKLLLLEPNAVDDTDGTLTPEVDHRLRDAEVNGSHPPFSLTVLTTGLQRETARRILDYVAARMAEADLKELDVHLAGGEPLLNPDGCRDVLELAAGYGLVSARMTTDGTLLTPALAQELAMLGLGGVEVTLDCDRAGHDGVLANVCAAAELTDIRWSFRIEVSRGNRAGLNEMIEQIAVGVDASRCSISFASVHDGDVDDVVGWLTHASDLGFHISRPEPAQPDVSFGAEGILDDSRESASEAAERFRDAVDTRVLDYLHRVGRLGLRAGTARG
jgi:uncharacterized protein